MSGCWMSIVYVCERVEGLETGAVTVAAAPAAVGALAGKTSATGLG